MDTLSSVAFTEAHADALAERGYAIIDGLLGADGAAAVRVELDALLAADAFRPARVGRGAGTQRADDVRSDRICWFRTTGTDDGDVGADDGVMPGPAVRAYLAALDEIRVAIARSCFLALHHLEVHAACYEPGTRYAAHKDTFVDDARRVISACYYVNDEWRADDGGCLRLHTDPPLDVEPRADRLVLFRSATMLHEVLRVHRRRCSLTGWMGATMAPV